MIHKRPFVDDASYEVACKHPRQSENVHRPAPILPLDDVHHKHQNSDGDRFMCQAVGRPASDLVTEVSHGVDKDFENGATSCFPNFLWISNAILEADNPSFFPEYFDGYQPRALFQPDAMFSSLDSPFRKSVPIGPEHQTDVPEWDFRDLNLSSNQLDRSDPQVALAQSSSLGVVDSDGYEEKLMGTCIIPMPKLEDSANRPLERNNVDCRCLDAGSIRCIRQHIIETRQMLRANLGEEMFEGLGFYDMGEEVAKKWAEEEEQAFHEIVLSNPVSLGKNFWDNLLAAFPSRKKKELVSYYFNVFMLRKRAEQNRFDPLNIDSDNDEWQRSEAGMAEEDEDSVVESPTGEASPAYYHEDHTYERSEDTANDNETCATEDGTNTVICRIGTDKEYGGDVDDISAHIGNSSGDCRGETGVKRFSGIPSNSKDEYDVQDDSCTSYEYQRDNVDCCSPLDGPDGKHFSQE